MKHTCPVCLFGDLPYAPVNYHVCPCCGTEFDSDTAEFSLSQLRDMWVASGAHWFFGRPPEGWNPWMQLIRGGHSEAVPRFEIRSKSTGQSQSVPEPFFIGQRPSVLASFSGEACQSS